jgi:peptidoglycan hydrolase-like protein with peptidoglycan-binding domain
VEEKMNLNTKAVWTRVVLAFLATGMLGLSLTALAFAAHPQEEQPAVSHSQDIKKVQESLRDKGYYHAKVDGISGPQTRAAIRQYQKDENLPVTGRLDSETGGKLGVEPKSVGGEFGQAGKDVGHGSEKAAHEMKKGKPLASGKEFGKGVGRFGKSVGRAVTKAVDPDSDSGDRQKKEQPESEKQPQ